jgi:hypothetical protein
MARVGAGDHERARPTLDDHVGDVPEGHVAMVRAAGARPADVHAHPIGRNVGHGVIEHLDVHPGHVAELLQAQVSELGVAAQGQIGAVDL